MDFSHCKDEKQAKDTYRKLAKLYHPDTGGSKEKMQELTKNYEACLERLKLGSAPGFQDTSFNRAQEGYHRWAKTNDPRSYGQFHSAPLHTAYWKFSQMNDAEKVEDPILREDNFESYHTKREEYFEKERKNRENRKPTVEELLDEVFKWKAMHLKAQLEANELNSKMFHMRVELSDLKSENCILHANLTIATASLKVEREKLKKAETALGRLKATFNKFKSRFNSPNQECTS